MTAPLTGDLPDWYRPQVQDTAQEILNYDQSNSAGSHSTTLTLPPNCISIGIGGYSDSISQISVTGATTDIAYLDESLAISDQYPYSIVPVFVRTDDQLTIAWTTDGSVNDHFHVYGYIITPPLALRKDGSLSVIENHAGDQFQIEYHHGNIAPSTFDTYYSPALVSGQAYVVDWIYLKVIQGASSASASAEVQVVNHNGGAVLGSVYELAGVAGSTTEFTAQPALYIPYSSSQDIRLAFNLNNGAGGTSDITVSVFYRIVNI